MKSRVQRWMSLAMCVLLCGGLSIAAATAGTNGSAGAAAPRLSASPGGVNLGSVTLGDFTIGEFTVTNTSAQTDTITGYETSGTDANDFGAAPDLDCNTDELDNAVINSGDSCTIDVVFFPGALGARSATLTLTDSLQTYTTVSLSGTGTIGYYQVSSTGTVAHFGDATFHGDHGGAPLNHPVVGMAATGDDGGYWLVASDGGIFNYGDAGFFGSAGGIALNKPIVGMAPTIDAGGYWLVATDGGIFSYGDAPFYGSTGSLHLNKPIVGMAPTPDGAGYWLVASDGGIFAYGDAQFYGSTGNIHLNQPIVAMAGMPTGNGYWFTAADGGLFNSGDAPFLGAAAGQGIGTVVGMATDGGPTLQALLDTSAIRHAHGTSGWAIVPDRPRYAGS